MHALGILCPASRQGLGRVRGGAWLPSAACYTADSAVTHMHLSMKRLEFRCQEKDLGLRREHLIVAIQIAQGSVAGHIDSATNVRESNQDQV